LNLFVGFWLLENYIRFLELSLRFRKPELLKSANSPCSDWNLPLI